MHLYLATELVAGAPRRALGPDEDEHLRLEHARSPMPSRSREGEIADAKSIVGLLWVARREQPTVSQAADDVVGPTRGRPRDESSGPIA